MKSSTSKKQGLNASLLTLSKAARESVKFLIPGWDITKNRLKAHLGRYGGNTKGQVFQKGSTKEKENL